MNVKGQNRLLHYPSEACGKRSAARFREVHRLPREVLRKRDRHRTSTKFRLGVIRWAHKLFKRPSYVAINTLDLCSECTSFETRPHQR
jgi:hypothetical protein